MSDKLGFDDIQQMKKCRKHTTLLNTKQLVGDSTMALDHIEEMSGMAHQLEVFCQIYR